MVLPETTIRAMARVAGPGQCSRFIDQAVRHFMATAWRWMKKHGSDPPKGRELRKSRPALIVQNDIGNRPITSTVRLPLLKPVHLLLASGSDTGLSVV